MWDIEKADDNSKATQFFIEIKDEKQLDFAPIARVDGSKNTFSTELLQKDKKYHFRVKGKNSAGFGEPAKLPQAVQLSKALGENTFEVYNLILLASTLLKMMRKFQ